MEVSPPSAFPSRRRSKSSTATRPRPCRRTRRSRTGSCPWTPPNRHCPGSRRAGPRPGTRPSTWVKARRRSYTASFRRTAFSASTVIRAAPSSLCWTNSTWTTPGTRWRELRPPSVGSPIPTNPPRDTSRRASPRAVPWDPTDGCRRASWSRPPDPASPISSHPSPTPCATAYPSWSWRVRPQPSHPPRRFSPVRPWRWRRRAPSGVIKSPTPRRYRSLWITHFSWRGRVDRDPSSSIFPRTYRIRC
mmetsp:Transcript_12091/g.25217  ORF Transcript_12091/g.25217 Transcript_12091/m.25217 type:complete len:247 (+) Transcript_12091:399-1139(+)